MRAVRDVVIIGAGPAGSSAAFSLVELGWDVLLVERDTFPRYKVCGEFLSPESQTSLHAMGLYAPVAALSPAPIDRAQFVSRLGVSLDVSLPGEAWGISRHALDATLAGVAERRGADLRTGTTVTGFSRTDTTFAVQLRVGRERRTVHTRAVLAACGRHSVGSLPPTTDRVHNGQRSVGVKCHYENVAMPARVELYLFPGGYAGVAPIEGGRVNVCLLASYATFARAGKSVPALIEAAADWNDTFGRRLAGGRARSETEVAVAPVDTGRPAVPWDRVACLGDSAAMIAPLCGDGMAMALRSAELCVPLADNYLRGRLSLAGWEEAHTDMWFAEFADRLRVGRLLESALSLPLVSDTLIAIGRAVPPLTAYLARATRGKIGSVPRSNGA